MTSTFNPNCSPATTPRQSQGCLTQATYASQTIVELIGGRVSVHMALGRWRTNPRSIPPTERRVGQSIFWVNVGIAILLGTIALLISYEVAPPHTFWEALSHEIGFALIVASLIWVAFDFFTAKEAEIYWKERIETISRNVFFGVLRKNFPEPLLDASNKLVLEQTFTRTNLQLTYTLMDEEFSDSRGETQKFVKLNAVARFRVRNMSSEPTPLPLGIALPNPMIDEMKPFCRVNKISYKRELKETVLDLAEAETKFREALKDDSLSQVPMEITSLLIAPGEEIDLLFDYNMAKEFEDTEVFTTRQPADSVVLTVIDKGRVHRKVWARSIHSHSLDDDTSGEAPGTYNFKLMRYLLPQQGFLIWWKSIPDRSKPGNPGSTGT